MIVDFGEIKNVISDMKQSLREDEDYGNHPILIRKREDDYISGAYNGIFDLGYASGSFTTNIVYGIKELVPKGYYREYKNLLVNKNADIKFSVETASGYLIKNASEDEESELWIDFATDSDDNPIIINDIVVSGSQCKMTSSSYDMFALEEVFWLNVIGE